MKANLRIILFCIVFVSGVSTLIVPVRGAGKKITKKIFPVAGGPRINPVNLSFKGEFKKKPLWFKEIKKKKIKMARDEEFVMKAFETNKMGTPEAVLKLWRPDERERMGKMILNPDLFRKNQGLFHATEAAAILAKIYYGHFILIFVQCSGENPGNFVTVYPLVKVNDDYFMTNQLRADPMYTFLTDKYRKELPLKKFP